VSSSKRRVKGNGEPHVDPRLVTLARQARGLTQSALARRVGVAQATISKIEAGVLSTSGEDLARLATALDFPHHFFTSQRRVDGPAVPEFVHRKRAKASTTALHRLHAVATIRQFHVETLLRSWEHDWNFPSLPIEDFEANPRRIAQTVRETWAVPPGPIYSMTGLVEQAGGIIIACDFSAKHIDAFSRRPADMPPLLFMSTALPPDRWRWSLAHEIGHAVMHAEADPYPGMERDADLFASELLLPASETRSQLLHLSLNRLAGLKRYWKVSMQALVMRAYDLELISDNQRRYMFMQLSKAGYRLREPEILDPPPEPPKLLASIVTHHRRNLSYSTEDLCDALAISQADLQAWYEVDQPPHLQLLPQDSY
jgi:Zn-dependent peptidase ImmA (M78 family)/transcriptional regulator with XRE-family HTH domain